MKKKIDIFHDNIKNLTLNCFPKKSGNKGPCMTITSSPDDFIYYSKPRIPTVRECARLQTFPDYYKFYGKKTTEGIRRAENPCVGGSVPPLGITLKAFLN